MAHLVQPLTTLGFDYDGVDDMMVIRNFDFSSILANKTLTMEVITLLRGKTVWDKFISTDYREDGTWTSPYTSFDCGLRAGTYETYSAITCRDSAGTVTHDIFSTLPPLELWEWYMIHYLLWIDVDVLRCQIWVNNDLRVDTSVLDRVEFDFGATTKILLGVRSEDSPYEYFMGIQGEIRLYDRLLSASEIANRNTIRRNIMDGCVLKLGTVGLVRGGGTQWLDESPYKNHGTVYGAKRVRCCHCNVVRDYGT